MEYCCYSLLETDNFDGLAIHELTILLDNCIVNVSLINFGSLLFCKILPCYFTYKHSINFFTFSSFFCELIHKLLPTSGEGETETLAMRNEYIHVCFLIHYLLLLLQLRFFNKLTELVIMNVGFLCIASQY